MPISKQFPLSDSLIRSNLAPFGLEVGQRELKAIREYMEILNLWNQKVSLTSLHSPGEILQSHFAESMFGAIEVPILHGRLADVGSGAGFPGVAVKIMRPSLDILLIEPNAKKAAFLAEVVRKLNLGGIKVFKGSAEEVPVGSGQFDFVTVRAVGDYEDLLSWCRFALVRSGKVVLWLGAEDAAKLISIRYWSWSRPIPVPVSRKRVILVGQAK